MPGAKGKALEGIHRVMEKQTRFKYSEDVAGVRTHLEPSGYGDEFLHALRVIHPHNKKPRSG